MNGLRFFTHNESDAVRFELAGPLCGADVESLHQAWQREALHDALRAVVVDITFITETDQHGRALLTVIGSARRSSPVHRNRRRLLNRS
jgi:hypothetical protein